MGMPQDEAKAFIVGLLVEEAARVMSFAPDRIDPHRPLSEFGMDSLMAVELRLALETRLGIDVPAEFREEYDLRDSRVNGVATYTRFRKFEVKSSEELAPPAPEASKPTAAGFPFSVTWSMRACCHWLAASA